jgi:hypothetical protein
MKRTYFIFKPISSSFTTLADAPLHIDGDPANTYKKFLIEVIPNAFKLIQP